MKKNASVWSYIAIIAITMGVAQYLLSCEKEEVDNTNDDSAADDDDSNDDDDVSDDDVSDDDTEQSIDSCEDIDVSSFGGPIAFQTQECNGTELLYRGGYSDEMNPPTGDPAAFEIYNQEDFDSFLSDAFAGSYSPCEVDFDTTTILGTFFSGSSWECTELEICGLHNDGNTINVVVFFHKCGGSQADYNAAYHVVNTDLSTLGYTWQITTKYTDAG
jgi:hypothetical protein